MNNFNSPFDILIAVVIFFILIAYIAKVQQNYEHRFAYFSKLRWVALIRFGSAFFFALIYLLYYGDGDTLYYFRGSRSIVKLANKDFIAACKVFLGNRTPEMLSLFDWTTGYPTYFKDANAWAVCRFTVPFYIAGFGSYWAATIIMNAAFLIPMWKFYKMLVRIYPQDKNFMLIAIFYMPSLVFWSSGILKDVWCYVAVLQLYMAVYNLFIRRVKVWAPLVQYIFWAYILISIRPFVFYTAFITTILWIGFRWLKTIESSFVKTIAFPAIMLLMAGIVIAAINQFEDVAEGKYATVESMMEHAVIIQQDLTRTEAYGDKTFDIGTFDASVSSMISKAPVAVIAGLFRPFIWEARSILMFFSGLESTFLLSLLIYLLIKTGVVGFIKHIQKDPFLISCIAFALMIGFFVGLTIANFGALVRYKIVLIPFFMIVLLRIYGIVQREEQL